MRKAHRKAHRRIWPLLALLVGAGLALALVLRPPLDQPVIAQEMTR
jgi:hypothetical protein